MKKVAIPIVFMAASALSLFVAFILLRSASMGFVLYYLVCCLGLPALELLAVRKVPPRGILELLGLDGPGRRGIAIGLGSGLGMAAIMLSALAAFSRQVFGDGRILSVLRGWGVSGNNMAFVYLVMLAFNGAVEEIFWRGFLYDRLRSLPNRIFALGLPVFFFGAQHYFVVSRLVSDPALLGLILFGILGAGAIWSLIRELTRSVVPCVISHAIVTAGYMGAFFFFTNLKVS